MPQPRTEAHEADTTLDVNALAERMEEKFGNADAGGGEEGGEEDAAADDEADAGDDDADDQSDEDAEHPESDTASDDRDGDDASTDDDSSDPDDDDDADTGEAESDDERQDDDDEEGEAEEDDEEDEDVSEEAKEALARNGAKLSVADIPEKYRPIVREKLKSIDAAFTRTMQQVARFRQEEVRLRADEKYRSENADLVIVDMLRKDPTLLDKVNKRWTRLDKEAEGNDADSIKDYEAALDSNISEKRRQAQAAIEAEHADYERRLTRADQIEAFAKTAARKANVPYGRAIERAIAKSIEAKPADKRDLSDDEIHEIIEEFAKDYRQTQRASQREASRDAVKRKAEARKGTPPKLRGKGGKSPSAARPAPFTGTLEEKMLKSARRIMPGARD